MLSIKLVQKRDQGKIHLFILIRSWGNHEVPHRHASSIVWQSNHPTVLMDLCCQTWHIEDVWPGADFGHRSQHPFILILSTSSAAIHRNMPVQEKTINYPSTIAFMSITVRDEPWYAHLPGSSYPGEGHIGPAQRNPTDCCLS